MLFIFLIKFDYLFFFIEKIILTTQITQSANFRLKIRKTIPNLECLIERHNDFLLKS
jgi:hypothetical protein